MAEEKKKTTGKAKAGSSSKAHAKKKTTSKKQPVVKKSPAKPRKKVPKEISWRVLLAAERPWLTILGLAIIAFTTVYLGIFIHFWASILAVVVFFAVLNPYFIPIKYNLTEEELEIKKFYYIDKRPWNMFRRFFLTRSGVVLSTFKDRQKFLDNFRGVQLFLPRDVDKRDKILDYLESKLPLDSGQNRK